jgi:phosphatidylserine/phosphatidylglycerophosphate/cardiolipin synthase-like enzyme
MTDALLSLPANVRHRLVTALETGLVVLPCTEVALRSALGANGEVLEAVAATLAALQAKGLTGEACAAYLRAVDEVEARQAKPDLVWSGPEVEGLYARDTRRVYEELLGSAVNSAWVSSYAYFDGPRAFEVLAKRMDTVPELDVTLMLNIQRKRGDASAADELVRRFADRFWGVDWPGSARPRVFFDPRSIGPGGPGGVLHAKAVVTDDESVFVTSANLTEAALDRNIEIGLLVRDRSLAATLVCHFCGLIDRGLLSPLPMN